MAHFGMLSFKITFKITLDFPNEPLCPAFEMRSNSSVQFHPILKENQKCFILGSLCSYILLHHEITEICQNLYYYFIKRNAGDWKNYESK